MDYYIIRNAYKAPVKRVFDYLTVECLQSPLPHQKRMLDEICDGVEFFDGIEEDVVKQNMNPGDYLFRYFNKNDCGDLVAIYPPSNPH